MSRSRWMYQLSRKKKTIKIWVGVFIVFLIGILTFVIVEHNLKPTLFAIAEAKARVIATQAINNVIYQQIGKDVDSRDLIFFNTDNNGRLISMQANTILINKIASDTTIKVQEALNAIQQEKILIPLGQVIGSQILASFGPKIPVTIIPIGTVQVLVNEKFEEAGFNQTKYMVFLEAKTRVRVVIPLISSSVEVATEVPIAETVLMGEVPKTLIQFHNQPSALLQTPEGQ